jgi:hypothetical protein
VIISKCELLKAIFFSLHFETNRKEENYYDEEKEEEK